MAAFTEDSNYNKIHFFSSTFGYIWLNFGMECQWKTGSQNCKNEKSAVESCHSGLLSVYKCDIAQIPMSKINFFKPASNNFFSKITGPIVLKFHMEHDKIGPGPESKMATITKNR